MTTETTDSTEQHTLPDWRAGLQLATNATWALLGVPTTGPFCVTQNELGGGEHTGSLHYLLLTPLLEIAEAYGASVTESNSVAGSATYSVTVSVDGISVTAWATNPSDAPTGGAA